MSTTMRDNEPPHRPRAPPTACPLPSPVRRFLTTRHHQSSVGRETPEQEARWDAEMLAYTVYAADDAGGVTTWDLKPLLLDLIRS